MGRIVKRLRIYDLSPDLTPEIKRKLTYNFKHEDDENYDELYHTNKLHTMLDEWIKEMNMISDPEREPKLSGFVDRCVIEADSGRLGYLSIDGEPGDWDLTIMYPVEGESIFGLHEVTLKEED